MAVRRVVVLVVMLCVVGTMTGSVRAKDVTLVKDGEPGVQVIVSPEVLKSEAPLRGRRSTPQALIRHAAEDLTSYIEKISGAGVELTSEPADGLVPIYLGLDPAGEKGAATPETTTEFGDAYLIDVTGERVVLGGESGRAVYYAAARLLHRMGVRWYAPTELGECVPERRTITVQTGRSESRPDYRTRHVWHHKPAETRWALRNRLGGPAQAQGHAFARFMNYGRNFKEHPEWYPVVDGKPVKHNANVSHPEVLEIFVRKVRKQFDEGAKWVCVGPDDGFFLDERPASRAMGSGRIDPLLNIPSSTDRLVTFVNRIAERLEENYSDRKLTFYVYSNHHLPPTVEPHPMIMGIVAPIGYSRYSSSGHPSSPISMLLEENVKAWEEATGPFGFYLYDFNLADTAMPYTRRLYFTREIPNMHRWGATDATTENMVNWHNMVPGTWVAANLLWDVETDVEALLESFYPHYYGPAAAPMRRYDELLEGAYEGTPAFAGNLWSMHRILLPIMDRLSEALEEAEKRVKDKHPYEDRVRIRRYSFNYARHYFAARQALNDFDLAAAARRSEAFLANCEKADGEFPLFFDRMNRRYWSIFHHPSYSDAGRIAGEGRIVYRFPDKLRAYLDDGEIGHEMGLPNPEVNTDNWITLRTHGVSLDEQGYPFFRGLIWYRHRFKLPAARDEGERLKLWIGGVDGPTQAYLNGHDLGRVRVSNFNPVEYDIGEAARPGEENVLIIASDNTFINELGTGGIMRPMLIYATR